MMDLQQPSQSSAPEPPGRPSWAYVWDPCCEVPLWRSGPIGAGRGHLVIEQFGDRRLGPQIVYVDAQTCHSRFTLEAARQFAQDILELSEEADHE